MRFRSGRTRDPRTHPPPHQAGHLFQMGRDLGERCLWHRWTGVRERIAHSLQMTKLDGRKLWRKAKLDASRSEEHTSELPSLMRRPYADCCLNNKHTCIIMYHPRL